MNRLKMVASNPTLIISKLIRRYLNMFFSKNKIFVHKPEYRADSENGHYVSAVVKSLKNQKNFENFKQNPAYQEILEHVSRKQGQEYLDILLSRNDNCLNTALENALKMDDIGNPIKYEYKVHNMHIKLSPTTLRYLKVTSDIKGLFGEKIGRIAEIGCGYGGQALMNDQLLNIDHATLFDLPFVNKLIHRYLSTIIFNGAFKLTTINESSAENYDLVISNYAFSELPLALQKVYIKKVIINSKCGYLTMNSGLLGYHSPGKLSLNELNELLPPFEIYEEDPQTYEFNYIILWGHNQDYAKKYFKLKKLNKNMFI